MDDEILERTYKERLDERLIAYIAQSQNLNLSEAMDAYYSSRLADKIATGQYGIQYLDYKVLAQILMETEPYAFRPSRS
ncbi:MAG: hypothetical protein ILP18_06205 [Treponema sp.]|nr:hypothetical protein [Treponema sp.]